MTTRLFFTVHQAADRVTRWGVSASSVLRWVTTSWGDQQTARGTSAPGAEGHKATTKEGHAGVFTTEAKEGGAGQAAGVGMGAWGGWAQGSGVGWAEGFFAVAAMGGCYESDTFHFFSSCDSFTLHVPSPMTHS